jgi:1-acyl-sn-glycerol-3-phosphate acyltransferase
MLSLLKLVGRPLFRILFSVEYHGLENVPERGPVILAGNHPSYLDPALIGLPVKRVIKFMAWDALFKVPLLGPLIKALGAFPVDIRKGKGEAAYRQALAVLESGYALGIFPEGQRSEQGPMGALRSGVARLAIESGAPIVPVTIGGASRAWPKWRLLPKPAKIIVRYHKPIHLDEAERAARRDDRGFQQEVISRVTASINRSLAPALRGVEQWERWYRQPPSHIRSYEWAPLLVALIATLIISSRGGLGGSWPEVWLPVAGYYAYLAVDLTLIKPTRLAKWLRNSMPIWLILIWHYQLTGAAGLPAGELNALLAGAVLAAFFTFFWEDYYTLQKFVRGLVVVYYCSLALMLGWAEPLGVFVAALGFIALFALWHRTVYHRVTAGVMLASLAAALFFKGPAGLALLAYAALAVVALGYLQTFVRVAYDIRKAGQVATHESAGAARR